jgi:hypothetical protein
MKFAIITITALALSASVAKPADAETVVAKSTWMEAMKTAIPNVFCSGKGVSRYFRECFKVTEDQCLEAALRATKVCLLSLADEIPQELHQPDDGRSWGNKLGKCAGDGYDIALAASRIDSAACKDPTNFK